jgi:nucleoside-diphosphate-sugar epimerase
VPVAGVESRSAVVQGMQPRLLDPTSPDALEQALKGARAVVNCVGAAGEKLTRVVRAVVEAAKRSSAALEVVHLSSMTVYGNAHGVVDESAPLRPDLGEYGAAHVAAEGIVAECPHAVIFRPGCEYGPGSAQWSTRIADLLLSRRIGDMGAQGDGFCNLVHVEDVTTAILLALQQRASGKAQAVRAFNLSSSRDLTWNGYLSRFARDLGAVPLARISGRWLDFESKLLAVPLKLTEALARPLRIASRLPPPLTASLRSLMRQRIQLDAARAERELGMRWRDLDSGLRETAQWYLNDRRGAGQIHV